MQSLQSRYLILSALFAVALTSMAVFDRPQTTVTPRWPSDDTLFAVDGWVTGSPKVESANSSVYVSREFRQLDSGQVATLSIVTSPLAKRIYRAGPEVPFLGSGYTVEPAGTVGLTTPSASQGVLLATRGTETVLAIHTYGERRGRFGNGAIAWGLGVLDIILDRPNDYYLARVLQPLNGLDKANQQAAVALAETLFPRLQDWYARF